MGEVEERIAHRRDSTGHTLDLRIWAWPAPAAAAIEERVEHAHRCGPATRFGLLDDDAPFPWQCIEHQQLGDPRRLEGLGRIEIAEVEDPFRALSPQRRREGVGRPRHQIVAFHGRGVGKARLAVPLRQGEQRVWRLDRGIGAPGVLVEERHALLDRGGAAGGPTSLAPAAQPAFERLAHPHQFMGCAVDADLKGARADAIGPVVGPVAALRADLVAVLAGQQSAEVGDGDEFHAVGAVLAVPAPDELGHTRVRRAIVDAHRVGRLAVEEVEGIRRIVLEFVDPARQQAVDQIPVAKARLAAAEQVVIAVPGQHLLAAWPLPAKGSRERLGPRPADRIDRRGVEGDSEVGQKVGEQPGDAVDIVLHRRLDLEAELVAQGAQRIEAAVHLLHIEQRRQVVLHARDVDAALLVPVPKAADLGLARLPQVAEEGARRFDRPAVLRLDRVVVGRLDQVERLSDELAMLAQGEFLVVGKADVGVRMVAHIDGLDLAHHCPPVVLTPDKSPASSRSAVRR